MPKRCCITSLGHSPCHPSHSPIVPHCHHADGCYNFLSLFLFSHHCSITPFHFPSELLVLFCHPADLIRTAQNLLRIHSELLRSAQIPSRSEQFHSSELAKYMHRQELHPRPLNLELYDNQHLTTMPN